MEGGWEQKISIQQHLQTVQKQVKVATTVPGKTPAWVRPRLDPGESKGYAEPGWGGLDAALLNINFSQ